MLKRICSLFRQDLRQTAVRSYRNFGPSCVRPLHNTISGWTRNSALPPHAAREMASGLPAKEIQPHKSLVQTVMFSMMDSLLSTKSGDLVQLRTIQESPILSKHLGDPERTRKMAEAMVHTPFPHRALRVLRLAHRLGCRLKQNVYEGVAYQLAETKQWHLIISLVSLGKKQSGRSTSRLLNWRARAYLEKRHYGLLAGLLEDFEKEKLKPTRRTFHLLVSGHIRNHDLGRAKSCLMKMEKAGFPVDPTTHALVITLYRTLGPDVDVQAHAFEALQDVGDHTSSTILNSLMRIHLDTHDVPGALRLLAFFDKKLVDPSLTGIDGVNTTPLGGGRHSTGGKVSVRGNNVFSSLLSQPPTPDVMTFSILIDFMASRRDLPRALRMLSRMIAAGIQPDARIAASLVHIHFVVGDELTAIHLVASMCDSHKVPLYLFSPLCSVHGLRGNCSLLPAGISLTIEVCNACIQGVLRTRGLKGGCAVLRIMRASSIVPNADTIEILLSHLESVERARPRDLIRTLRYLSSSSAAPSLRHLHIILKASFRLEKHRLFGIGWNVSAAKFSRFRKDVSLHPAGHILATNDNFDPTAGIVFTPKCSHRALIKPIVQSLVARRIRSDKATHALRIRHEAVAKCDMERAREIFQDMLARGIHPNEYHFSALMEGYSRVGDLPAAEDVMRSAVKAGVTANVVMFTILIVGHARQGRPKAAMRTFELMVASGIKPDAAAIDAVVSAYFFVGAYRMARQVLLSLWPYVQAMPRLGSEHATLKQLICELRSLRTDHRGPLAKDYRRRLRRDLKGLMMIWNGAKRHVLTCKPRKRFCVEKGRQFNVWGAAIRQGFIEQRTAYLP